MILPTLIFLGLALTLFIVNTRTGKHWEGCINGYQQLLAALPVILLALLLAGLMEALIPQEFIERWLAREAGMTGVLLGTLGGLLMAFGPYASYPIIASVYHAGAGLGTTVALLSGWAFLNLSRLPYESGFFGLRFSLLRMVLTLPFCVLAGAIAHLLEILLF